MKTSSAILRYDPEFNINGNCIKNPWWVSAVLKDSEIANIYLRKARREFFNPKIEPLNWPPHITILRGIEPRKYDTWKYLENEEIEFEYDEKVNKITFNVKTFYIIFAYSDIFKYIRTGLGFASNEPFHITVGRKRL